MHHKPRAIFHLMLSFPFVINMKCRVFKHTRLFIVYDLLLIHVQLSIYTWLINKNFNLEKTIAPVMAFNNVSLKIYLNKKVTKCSIIALTWIRLYIVENYIPLDYLRVLFGYFSIHLIDVLFLTFMGLLVVSSCIWGYWLLFNSLAFTCLKKRNFHS